MKRRMKQKSKNAISIIGGADGPTSIFIAGHSKKQPLKIRIKNSIYRYKRKKVEKTIVANPHSLSETVQYAKEKYELTVSDYESILKRFGSEAMIQRFALKFLKDGCFSDRKNALEAKDEERAFRAAHTLKGVCINQGFDRLYNVSAELPAPPRGRAPPPDTARGRLRS